MADDVTQPMSERVVAILRRPGGATKQQIADELHSTVSAVDGQLTLLRKRGVAIEERVLDDWARKTFRIPPAPHSERALVLLRRPGGATIAEIATELDCSYYGAHAALARLRDQGIDVRRRPADEAYEVAPLTAESSG